MHSTDLADTVRQLSEKLDQLVEDQQQDIIAGVEPIASELNLGYEHTRRGLISGKIPARRLGQVWIASRSTLRRWVAGEIEWPPAGPVSQLQDFVPKRPPGRPRKQGKITKGNMA